MLLWLKNSKVSIANEGFVGAAAGFLLGSAPVVGTLVGGATKGTLEAKKREIERVSNELLKLRQKGAKAALDDSKITDNIYKSEIEYTAGDIIEGAIFGTIPLIGAFINGSYGSQLQDKNNELKRLIKELNATLAAVEYSSEKK